MPSVTTDLPTIIAKGVLIGDGLGYDGSPIFRTVASSAAG